jgi:hypothetical protein
MRVSLFRNREEAGGEEPRRCVEGLDATLFLAILRGAGMLLSYRNPLTNWRIEPFTLLNGCG